MPELPEVETIKRGLSVVLTGATIERAELRRPDLRFPLPLNFAKHLKGKKISHIGRRAKYLVANVEGDLVMAMHLGMSGSFRIEFDAPPLPASRFERSGKTNHDHVVFHLRSEAGAAFWLVYNDPRRFGYMTLMKHAEFGEHPYFAGLGIEPLGGDMTAVAIAPEFAKRRSPLKMVLLDQRVIAGLGNIYVCEALWRSRLSPLRTASSLVEDDGTPKNELAILLKHVQEVLEEAIISGGSTLKDYRKADGGKGSFQDRFAVYGKTGCKCPRPRCRGTVERIEQSGRSTFFCRTCQK